MATLKDLWCANVPALRPEQSKYSDDAHLVPLGNGLCVLYDNTSWHGEPIYSQYWIGAFDQNGKLVGQHDSSKDSFWNNGLTALVELRPGVLFGLTNHDNGEGEGVTFGAPGMNLLSTQADVFNSYLGLTAAGEWVFSSDNDKVMAISRASGKRQVIGLHRRLIHDIDPETGLKKTALLPETIFVVCASRDGRILVVNQDRGFLVCRILRQPAR